MLDIMRDESVFDSDGGQGRKKSKAQRRAERRANRTAQREAEAKVKPVKALNASQADYLEALNSSNQVFGVGSAGTGKTFLAAHHAASLLVAEKVERIIVARPAVSKKKHQQGFQPGKSDEKIAPWMVPVMDGLRAATSPAVVERLKREGKIEFVPFEFMRGRTFYRAAVILDEAQNCDLDDLRLFLTRIGEDSHVVVCGDPDQPDIPDSGLERVLEMIEENDISAEIVEFDPEDVVRSKLAKEWVRAFDRED